MLQGFDEVCQSRVGRFASVLYAGNIEPFAFSADCEMFVAEHPPAALLFKRDDLRAMVIFFEFALTGVVDAIIMIAEHGHHAVARLQLRKDSSIGMHFRGIDIDQIAREHDEVGVFLVDAPHHLFHKSRVSVVSAEMKVGDLYDAVTVESGGQILDGNFNFVFLQNMRAEGNAEHLRRKHNQRERNGQVDTSFPLFAQQPSRQERQGIEDEENDLRDKEARKQNVGGEVLAFVW